jgi:hypothetical protein
MPTSLLTLHKESAPRQSRIGLDKRAIFSWFLIVLYSAIFWSAAVYWTFGNVFR